jgi:CDP-paratose 2-epimerase
MSGAERPKVLITGGAGFIGANLADRLLADGREVFVLDNMSRPAVERNLAWLRARHGDRLRVEIADVRDAAAVERAVAGCATVFHFAAQVAVTTSLVDPLADFEVNARGTINVLEAARRQPDPPAVLFTSTNKVYGALHDVPLAVERTGAEPDGCGRYVAAEHAYARYGVSEARPLDLYSPYGCSKGAADQYVCDWARSYGLSTLVLRMSCIYGPRQLGTEDQGWVAHFLRQARAGRPLTIYGDGRQVRDLLYVDDLVAALIAGERALAQPGGGHLAGRAFNLGGGPDATLSLLELVERVAAMRGGRRPEVRFSSWRTGDQRWYVSDTRAFEQATGWRRAVSLDEGLARLDAWIADLDSAPTAEVAA